MGCFNKFALFVVNFIVFAIGVAVIVLASLVISKDTGYGVLLGQGVFTLPVIILIAGLIILLIGFLGCCGALKESSCMLKTYAAILLVMLIAEIILAILVLVYTSQAEAIVKDTMGQIFNKYDTDDDALDNSINHAMHDLKCCGVSGYMDWTNYTFTTDHPNSVPKGCCKEMSEGCGDNVIGKGDIDDIIYTDGCYEALKEDLQGAAIGLGIALILLAIIQTLSITCACGIAKKSSHYA